MPRTKTVPKKIVPTIVSVPAAAGAGFSMKPKKVSVREASTIAMTIANCFRLELQRRKIDHEELHWLTNELSNLSNDLWASGRDHPST